MRNITSEYDCSLFAGFGKPFSGVVLFYGLFTRLPAND
jgi:hypothetical protein